MPKLRRISGDEAVAMLGRCGFRVLRQKGSHLRLAMRREGRTCFVTIPPHDELDRGTLRAIIRAVDKYLPEEIIRELFYR